MATVISARDLGQYASPSFCPRCAWIRLNVKPLPYQVFPGIFSSIDSYNKRVVLRHFERHGRPPDWLAALGPVKTPFDPPHWTRFSITDSDAGVTVRGQADGIFLLQDGSYAILDYKTSRYTPGQDALFPLYEVQLNAYAYIGERLDLRPVSRLALVYMEPLTGEEAVGRPEVVSGAGFSLAFEAAVVPVDLKPDLLIPPLLAKVKETAELRAPPKGREGCKDCRAVEGLLAAMEGV